MITRITEHEGGDRQVAAGSEIGRRGASAGPGDTDPHQRDADHCDNGSRHDGRKEAQRVLHDRRDEQAEQSADDNRAIDAGETKTGHGSHGQHGRYRNRGYTHDDGKPDAERTDADGLHQGGNAAGEKVGIDQQRKLIFR
jgi:hypothetical protein